VAFGGPSRGLQLDNSGTFSVATTGFATGDQIDLADFYYTAVPRPPFR
jgi:hypothetical protein